MKTYTPIAGGYSYCQFKIGMTVRAPNGKEVYIQPGDDETAMMRDIESLEEVDESKRDIIADMILGAYFTQ